MREKFIRFMNGRNGMDELARAESWVVMILLLVSIFTRSAILDILAIGLMIHMYFRVFSRNVNKRYAENQKFLNARYEWTVKAERRKKRFAQRKQYKFFKCPMCKQEVRVPRGHGKICITCPKCREQFVRRSYISQYIPVHKSMEKRNVWIYNCQ